METAWLLAAAQKEKAAGRNNPALVAQTLKIFHD
jgi:hypothetical protein